MTARCLDDGAFVNPGVPADQHVVFDDDGQRADGLDDAADLRAGAEVHAPADLRARSDERVRVDERAFVDVRADVDVHRRHADDAARDERAFADRRAARHDAHAGGDARLLQRHRVLVVERPAAVIGRHVHDVAEPEPEQDALLDPRVDAPARSATPDRGSAARTSPAPSARCSSKKASRAAVLSALAPWAKRQ